MSMIQPLILTKEKTENVGATFINEMNFALAEQPSSLQMCNTYIPELPNGTGRYFSTMIAFLTLINSKKLQKKGNS